MKNVSPLRQEMCQRMPKRTLKGFVLFELGSIFRHHFLSDREYNMTTRIRSTVQILDSVHPSSDLDLCDFELRRNCLKSSLIWTFQTSFSHAPELKLFCVGAAIHYSFQSFLSARVRRSRLNISSVILNRGTAPPPPALTK